MKTVWLLALLALTLSWVWLIRQGGWLLPVTTADMSPAIPARAAVIVTPSRFGSLAIGDIIAYQQAGDLMFGRLVRAGSQLTVRGDNRANAGIDTLEPDQVVGRVNAVLPDLGPVLQALHQPLVLLPLVYLPALAVIGREIGCLATVYRQPDYRFFG